MLNTKKDFKQIEMDTIQQEQLFTDVTPEQAETISAGVQYSVASAPFGSAQADISRSGPKSFKVSQLGVLDYNANGYAVYAKFQGRAGNGTTYSTPTKRFDRKGAGGPGTTYTNLTGTFSENISDVRVLIYQEDPGADSVDYGNWVTI